VTFPREKRMLLVVAALLVALPLPLTDSLEWPVLILFLAVVGWIGRRAWQGSERWLTTRALNLLGLAYLPLLVFDFLVNARIQLVRPVLHLTLFGLAAKLGSLVHERDKWQAWIGIFFLFLASMATSTHPAVVIYLVAFLAVAVMLLVRFVHLHVSSSFGGSGSQIATLPIRRFVAGLLLATVALSVPLFALLPRVRTQALLGSRFGAEPPGSSMGFSDDLSLDLIGRIRDNPAIALRVRFDGRYPDPERMRFKAATYEAWEGRSWRRSERRRTLRPSRRGATFHLLDGTVVGRAHLILEPLGSTSLAVPVSTLAVASEQPALGIDGGGALVLPGSPSEVVEYDALLGDGERSAGDPPGGEPVAGGTLDPQGLTPRIRALADGWAGQGAPQERAAGIERHLLDEYGYTTLFVGRGGDSPIETFLFDTRRGHCEYFASAMALMLRAEGIPSRVVTGFYGAEWSPWEGSWIVRQSNAHAWVEAWIDGEGWRTYDPTPPDGRPLVARRGIGLYLRQAWDAVLFRWDRWVISYEFEDQVSLLGRVRTLWDDWMRALLRRHESPPNGVVPASTAQPAGEVDAGREEHRYRAWLAGLGALITLAAAIGLWRLRGREPWSATLAYRRLRAALRGGGLPVPDSLAPMALARLADRRLPAARTEASRVVDGYLREAFAGRALQPGELEDLRRCLHVVERASRRLRGRSRRRPGAQP